MNNKIIFLLGPSGVGKTTVRKHIESNYSNIKFIPSYTTRPPREHEIDGIDYFFITKEKFIALKENKMFIEWEEHFGNFYGIFKGFCEDKLEKGFSLIKEIEIGGYLQIREASLLDHNSYFSIFIYPENVPALFERIKRRGGDDIDSRIESISNQLQSASRCDRIIVSKENCLEELIIGIEKIICEILGLKYKGNE